MAIFVEVGCYRFYVFGDLFCETETTCFALIFVLCRSTSIFHVSRSLHMGTNAF